MARSIIILRNTASLFPAGWDVMPEDDNWVTLYPQGREQPNIFLHACLMASSGSRAVYVVCAPNQAMASRITAFASASTNAWTLAELRASNTALAVGIKQVWREKVSGSISFSSSIVGHDYPGILFRNDD